MKIEEICELQNKIIRELERYCNGYEKNFDKYSFRRLSGLLKNLKGEREELKLKLCEFNKYPAFYKYFLLKIKKYVEQFLKDYVKAVIVHGSLATLDFTEYSDADILMILKDEVIMSDSIKYFRKHLQNLLRIIYQFDALQHHGIFILPEIYLEFYPEEYLPVDTLKHSVLLYPKELTLFIKKRFYKKISEKRFKDVINFLINSPLPADMYNEKRFLSAFFLLPALYLSCKNKLMYKKYSFDEIKNYLPAGIFKNVSTLRERWRRLRLPWILSLLPVKFLPKIIHLYRKRQGKVFIYRGIKKYVALHFHDCINND